MLETRLSAEGRPQTLLAHRRHHPWPASIALQALPGGAIVLVMSQGEEVFHVVLPGRNEARTDILRITFAWDSERRFGRIAVERPESDSIAVKDTPAPPPPMLEDIHTLARRPQLVDTDGNVIFFAISDAIEPLGPMPTLTGDVPVLTAEGYRPVARLRTGDTVRTQCHGVVPVLHRIARTVPALGSFRPVRLRAPYFGLRHDLVVAPQQRLVIGGSEVEYMFGREAVLIPASVLVNGFAARYEAGHRTIRYHHLVLPGHEPLVAAGAEVESVYVGRLRRRPARLAQTLLADCPRTLLPEHARAGLKVLGAFEAITLAEARAA
jgi:hypothetical protein